MTKNELAAHILKNAEKLCSYGISVEIDRKRNTIAINGNETRNLDGNSNDYFLQGDDATALFDEIDGTSRYLAKAGAEVSDDALVLWHMEIERGEIEYD